MSCLRVSLVAGAFLTAVVVTPAPTQVPPTQPPAAQPQPGGAPPQSGAPAAPRRPRPYNQVITDRAHTEHGGITVHRVYYKWFF
jgi:hypothetical protein